MLFKYKQFVFTRRYSVYNIWGIFQYDDILFCAIFAIILISQKI